MLPHPPVSLCVAKALSALCDAHEAHFLGRRVRPGRILSQRLPVSARTTLECFFPIIRGLILPIAISPATVKNRTSMSIAPNFFIIGAPKSGTTALSQYLGTHPNVFFSRVKEPHFFDLDASKRV